MFKKVAAVVGTTVVAGALLSSAVFAAPSTGGNTQPVAAAAAKAVESNIKQTVTTWTGELIVPFDAQMIPAVTHTGTGAYYNKFTTAPANGWNLNIYVKNNGTGTVKFNVKRNGVDLETVDVAAGTGKTRTFTEYAELAGGLSGDWEVYVYTTTGAKMDLSISARQY
jgi:hypothetical protein